MQGRARSVDDVNIVSIRDPVFPASADYSPQIKAPSRSCSALRRMTKTKEHRSILKMMDYICSSKFNRAADGSDRLHKSYFAFFVFPAEDVEPRFVFVIMNA